MLGWKTENIEARNVNLDDHVVVDGNIITAQGQAYNGAILLDSWASRKAKQ